MFEATYVGFPMIFLLIPATCFPVANMLECVCTELVSFTKRDVMHAHYQELISCRWLPLGGSYKYALDIIYNYQPYIMFSSSNIVFTPQQCDSWRW